PRSGGAGRDKTMNGGAVAARRTTAAPPFRHSRARRPGRNPHAVAGQNVADRVTVPVDDSLGSAGSVACTEPCGQYVVGVSGNGSAVSEVRVSEQLPWSAFSMTALL